MHVTDMKHGSYWVREYNKKKLYNLIRENAGVSRAELTRMIDLSPTSVSIIISILMEEGLVRESGLTTDGKIGRKAIRLHIIPEKVLALAIDIDVGMIRGMVVDIAGTVIQTETAAFENDYNFDRVIDILREMICTLMERLTPEQRENVIGLGITAPGYIDRERGVIHHSPQIGWRDFHLVSRLMEKLPFNLEVSLDNNVKAEAMAECIFGTAGRIKSAVILDFGSGVGHAYVSGGRIQPGVHNTLGEIGHILVGSNGIKCSCGRYGCLRTHIARTSIEERTGLSIRACVSAADAGDPLCADVLNEAVRYTSIWVANAINLYDPAAIYLGGSMLSDWPEFYDKVAESYRAYMWEALSQEEYPIFKTFVSQYDNPVIGAASIVFYRYLMTGVQIEAEPAALRNGR